MSFDQNPEIVDMILEMLIFYIKHGFLQDLLHQWLFKNTFLEIPFKHLYKIAPKKKRRFALKISFLPMKSHIIIKIS
jgi:hypothetical protein